jgi:hypothetical protein
MNKSITNRNAASCFPAYIERIGLIATLDDKLRKRNSGHGSDFTALTRVVENSADNCPFRWF